MSEPRVARVAPLGTEPSADARCAWWLNFDAELELAFGAGYAPARSVRAHAARLVVPELVAPGDILLTTDVAPAGASTPVAALVGSGCVGRAWCPTPRALAGLARAGVALPAAPSLAVLRAVNHRAFSAALGQTLPGAAFVRERAALDAVLGAMPAHARVLLKRPFGFAGRGRRALVARARRDDDERWIAASLRGGEGLQIEPWVERAGDFALHAYLAEDARLTLGEPTVQRTTASGAWLETLRARPGELAPEERDALVGACVEAGAALAGAGYFGPFGIDAFRYRSATGALAFNPRCEINARYSMGWAVGMGRLRPDRSAAPNA